MKKLSELGISHLIVPIIVVVVMAGIGTYILAVSHAAPTSDSSTAVPAIQTTWFQICLKTDSYVCLQTHGTGSALANRVTIQTDSTSLWHVANAPTGYYIGNKNHQCLHAVSGDTYGHVYLKSSCSGKADMWTFSAGHIENVGTRMYMGADPLANNAYAKMRSPKTGFYWTWTFPYAQLM